MAFFCNSPSSTQTVCTDGYLEVRIEEHGCQVQLSALTILHWSGSGVRDAHVSDSTCMNSPRCPKKICSGICSFENATVFDNSIRLSKWLPSILAISPIPSSGLVGPMPMQMPDRLGPGIMQREAQFPAWIYSPMCIDNQRYMLWNLMIFDFKRTCEGWTRSCSCYRRTR